MAAGSSVATINVNRVFNEMQETKDMITRLQNDFRSLQQQMQDKDAKAKELKSARDLTKPNTSQWEEANKAYTEAVLTGRVFTDMSRQELDRRQKVQTKQLYDEIVAAATELAKQRNIDFVIAERRLPPNEVVEKMTPDDLGQYLAKREILYTSSKADLTSDVIALLDSKFKAQNPQGAK